MTELVSARVARLAPPESVRIILGGCPTDLTSRAQAVAMIGSRMSRPGPPLAVVSVNLDHVHHFRPGGRWARVLDAASSTGRVEWLHLVDGAPLATQARRVTGREWPRLAGSDLIDDLLDEAQRHGGGVGFLGGAPETQAMLRGRLHQLRPGLRVTGWWAPSRPELVDPEANAALVTEVRASGTDLLVVGLGKPRQELWIAEHGVDCGARVLLAFGAVVDFLAGRVTRAPAWMSDHSLEWAYRLALEPRRLSHRYLVDGPPAYVSLRRRSTALVPRPRSGGSGSAASASMTILVVTCQSEAVVGDLLDDLFRESGRTRLRVVVKDNGSTDHTVEIVRSRSWVHLVPDRSNLGHAGGVNAAMAHLCEEGVEQESWLVLDPGVRLRAGALAAMLRRLALPGVGVVVPQVIDAAGDTYPSLRRAPRPLRTLADALCVSRVAGGLSEVVQDPDAYHHPHPVDWATGGALLVRAEVARVVGPWDERYFLSGGEIDFLTRARARGWQVWFEPAAVVQHTPHASGPSPGPAALMAVNRVRYADLHLGTAAAVVTRAVLVGAALLRVHPRDQRAALPYLLSRSRWSRLPAASRIQQPARSAAGSVIIPAHAEEAVLPRTLAPLAELARSGRLEVVVAANGCQDRTVALARGFAGVRVLDLPGPSKTAALNAADAIAHQWPRLYLDADVEITAKAVTDVLHELSEDDGPLAARPPFRYDTGDATWPVRAFYRARSRLPGTTTALWGAGAYALSEQGHVRIGSFPDVIADDLYVDSCFARGEAVVVATDPVVVHTPRDVPGLLAVLRRASRGNIQLRAQDLATSTTAGTVRDLLGGLRGPLTWMDAVVYAALVTAGRARGRRPGAAWDRDDSSRVARRAGRPGDVARERRPSRSLLPYLRHAASRRDS